MNGSCQMKNVKWPNETYTRRARGSTETGSMPSFTVDFVTQPHPFSLNSKKLDGVQDENCCAALVCQEIKQMIGLDFHFQAERLQECIMSCSRYKTLNEMVFLLYKAINNRDISEITLPSCKIEDGTAGDVNLPEYIDDEVREVPTYVINFPTVLSMAKVEYEYILKEGWTATVLEDQLCGLCCSGLNVLGYQDANIALANGISIETVEELTHGQRMTGYINCHCRFHLKCLLKCIRSGLTKQFWRCNNHQTCANTIFVANNLGFPKKKLKVTQFF